MRPWRTPTMLRLRCVAMRCNALQGVWGGDAALVGGEFQQSTLTQSEADRDRRKTEGMIGVSPWWKLRS